MNEAIRASAIAGFWSKRYWPRTRVQGNCIVWTGPRRRGYGHLGRGCIRAHRVLVDVITGIPRGAIVLHTCDNRACVKPQHLDIGTHELNQLDKVTKGRQARGARHGRAKLTARQVSAIRRAHARGESIRSLARRYPVVARITIARVVRGATWRK